MSADAENVSILKLAENILESTKEITQYLQSKNVTPTFSPKSDVIPNTVEYQGLVSSLRTSIDDLQRLVEGPNIFWRNYFMRQTELAAMQIALDFNLVTLIPADGEISYRELASKTGLDEDRLTRTMRLLITNRFFQEPKPGYISHNSFTVFLLDEELRSITHYALDEMGRACLESGVAMRAEPQQADSLHCPFHTKHGVPVFQYYAERPVIADRFSKAMAGWRRMKNNVEDLINNFDWAKINGTVVDIGGGSGHVSIVLAQEFPHLSFVIQDESHDMMDPGRALLTDGIRDRVSFEKTDFFKAQTYKGAAAYLIRQCTHDWTDKEVVTIFKGIVPGLEGSSPETPLLINDVVLPEPGAVPRLMEREMRHIDMLVMVALGARQRSRAEFDALLKEADPRYEIRNVHDQCTLGLLEVYLRR